MEVLEKPTKTAVFNQVQKKIRMELWDVVKFQIIVHCYNNRIPTSEGELECLTLLAISGNAELGVFCTDAIKHNISTCTQSIRNVLVRVEKKNLILKTGKGKKRISINPAMNIQVKGNILLDYKVYRLDPEES